MSLEHVSHPFTSISNTDKLVGIAKSYVIAMERQNKQPHPYLAAVATMTPQEAANFQPDEELLDSIDEYQEAQRQTLIKGIADSAFNSLVLLHEEVA